MYKHGFVKFDLSLGDYLYQDFKDVFFYFKNISKSLVI